MDVVRILVRTKYSMILNERFNVENNKSMLRIKLCEHAQGPMMTIVPKFLDTGDAQEGLEFSSEK